MPKPLPKISVVIPTLNAAAVLTPCLASIRRQSYPQNLVDIIICDGGSTDSTLEIARNFNCRIINNPLVTAEAGKTIGVSHSEAVYIALIDSDNILPHPRWLTQMLRPLENNPDLIGAEPLRFTYRPQAGYIERYCALIGANDPYAYVTGVYDRYSRLSRRWTGLTLPTVNFPDYLVITLSSGQPLPTIGANGTIFRRSFISRSLNGPYLFDIDQLSSALTSSSRSLLFAKVKTGIIHSFCESSLKKYCQKQRRRLTDLYYYRSYRRYDWTNTNRRGILKYLIYTLTVFPVVADTLRGYLSKPDPAWLFHPLASYISLYFYTTVTIKYYLGLIRPVNRAHWSQ